MVHAGLGGPVSRDDLYKSLYGNPCDCGGGIITSPPSSHSGPTDCGEKIAYLVSYASGTGPTAPSYQCVKKPKVNPESGKPQTCPCKKFEESVHSTCYTQTQSCVVNNKTYWMASLTRDSVPVAPGHLPTVVGSSPFMQAGCNGKIGDVVCWQMVSPVHISDGGGGSKISIGRNRS